MPTLTGRLTYVTGHPIPPESISHVTVTASVPRAAGQTLTTTHPATIDPNGTLTVDLEPGPATMTAVIDHDFMLIHLLVEPDMDTIHDAAQAALDRR